jgi:hypothetical protein
MFEVGTEWTTPMYSCASAIRVLVKTVSFSFNQTTSGAQSLDGLSVVDIKPKDYPDPSNYPTWALENGTRKKWLPGSVRPLWGLVAAEDHDYQNISYVRSPHLWLSGETADINVGRIHQNLPAVDFPFTALHHAYEVKTGRNSLTSLHINDFSGSQNLPLYNLWKNLSSTPGDSARIINLVWTDIAANAVVGTKGWIPSPPVNGLTKRATIDGEAVVAVPITIYARTVQYNLKYAIPGIIVLAIFACAVLSSAVILLLGRTSPGTLKTYLNRLSPGRIMTAFLLRERGLAEENSRVITPTSTSQWLQRSGRTEIDISSGAPRATGYAMEELGDMSYRRDDEGAMMIGKR